MRPEKNEEALRLLHQAVELDPNYAPALAYLAWSYEQRLTRGWGAYGDNDSQTAIALAHRAIAADRDDAHALAAAGFVLVVIARDHDSGLQAAERAHELNPNVAMVNSFVGASKLYGGDPDGALRCFEEAVRVSPSDPGAFLFHSVAAFAHLFCGRPTEALESAKKSARMYPDWDSTYRVMIAALTQLGRLEEARSAVLKLRELAPAVTVLRLRDLPFRDPASLDMILDGLAMAELPE